MVTNSFRNKKFHAPYETVQHALGRAQFFSFWEGEWRGEEGVSNGIFAFCISSHYVPIEFPIPPHSFIPYALAKVELSYI